MLLKHKIWLLTTGVIALISAADFLVGYRAIEARIREEVSRDAQDIRGLLMATRRVYHKQFISSGLAVSDATVGFLPAHALSRISKDFPNWSRSGLHFNNVSDRPRNPENRADPFEMEAIAWFRENPKAESRLVEIQVPGGQRFYHYTAPIWIEDYCLRCHGERSGAPASIAATYDSAYDYKDGELRGVMSIKLPTDALRAREYRDWRSQFAVRLGGYLVLLFTLGIFLNRAVAARLSRLETVTHRFAEGDYGARSQDAERDEVGQLSEAFNKMGADIQERDAVIRKLSDDRQRAIEALRENKEDLERIVTERTAELADRARRLEEANAQMNSFSYSVSHDLRAPLRAMNGYARVLDEEERQNLSPDGQALLDRVIANSRKMDVLVEDILDFSRISRADLRFAPLDMTALAREVADDLREQYPRAAVVIDPLPQATGDPAMVRQVWANLLGNALKFSSKKESPEVRVGSLSSGKEIAYYVRDNGAGFDMAYVDKLFTVFERLHSEREFPGTGAGLAIVKRIVDRHGGRVWAEAALDAGATFFFTLPQSYSQ